MRTLMLLFFGVTSSWAVDYELMLEDPDIFAPCTDGPPGSINARQAVNLDDFVIEHESDILHPLHAQKGRPDPLDSEKHSTWITWKSIRTPILFIYQRILPPTGTWSPTIVFP